MMSKTSLFEGFWTMASRNGRTSTSCQPQSWLAHPCTPSVSWHVAWNAISTKIWCNTGCFSLTSFSENTHVGVLQIPPLIPDKMLSTLRIPRAHVHIMLAIPGKLLFVRNKWVTINFAEGLWWKISKVELLPPRTWRTRLSLKSA